MDKIARMRGGTTVTLALGRLYDGVLRGDSGRDLDPVFVKLVVLRAWGRRVWSDMGDVDVCVAFPAVGPGVESR